MSEKIHSSYIDYGHHCNIFLVNCPLIKIRGCWVMDVNMRDYEDWLSKEANIGDRRPSDILIIDCGGGKFKLVQLIQRN